MSVVGVVGVGGFVGVVGVGCWGEGSKRKRKYRRKKKRGIKKQTRVRKQSHTTDIMNGNMAHVPFFTRSTHWTKAVVTIQATSDGRVAAEAGS